MSFPATPGHAFRDSRLASLAALAAACSDQGARMEDSDPEPDPTPAPTPAPTPPHGDPEPTDPPKPGPDHAAEARKWEKRSKDNHKALEDEKNARKASDERLAAVLKAAGLAPDTEDPAKVAERLAAENKATAKERDDANARIATIERERKLERAAHAAGVDVVAFMDSRSIDADLAALADDAPDTAYAALVKKRLEAAPYLALTPGPRVPAPNRGQGSSDKAVGATGVAAGAALYAARRGRKPATTGNA